MTASILINGAWRPAAATDTFHAYNPANGAALEGSYPVSSWADVDAALDAAAAAFRSLRSTPGSTIAAFLRAYASNLEAKGEALCQTAADETGLPFPTRLHAIELPRTCGQLRQAADAAEDGSWRMPVIDAATNIRSVLEPIGPVAVFGPNNFPLAFNGISGGDFASAIASGNPVIAKAHRSHPGTCRILAECAQQAVESAGLPAGTVQMIYAIDRADGLRLVSDRRLGAAGFTGSRGAGMALKQAADAVGKPIYLEMSSINPLVILPGALEERLDGLVTELATSALMAAGQFCTNPGLILMTANAGTEQFVSDLAARYAEAPCGTLLSSGVQGHLASGIRRLVDAGATVVTGGQEAEREGCAYANTLLRVDGKRFLAASEQLQAEAFGNATLVVVADSLAQMESVIENLEGNLTGCIYSAFDGRDDAAYAPIADRLRPLVGRLLNDKMPTGVAVSPAMNHGGPFPATGQPHFTAVGIPASLRRFTMLACYDNIRPERLPAILRDSD